MTHTSSREKDEGLRWTSLGLRLRARRATWFACVCLAAYYVASMSRDLALYDSGELALAAFQPGLGHPPGQPLHTLLGWVAAHLCFASPLFGINLMSALPAALSLVPAASIAETLSRRRARTSPLPAAVLALFAVHADLWEPATRVEVYALATLFALWALARLLPHFVDGAGSQPLAADTFWAGLALGLAASVNPVIAAVVGLSVLPGLLQAARAQRTLPAVLARALLGGGLGLLPYAYLPLAAARSDVMVWGGLHSAQSYLRYLTLRDYARNQTLGFGGFCAHVSAWLVWATRRLLAPAFILCLGSFVRARFRVPLGRYAFAIVCLGLLAQISFNVVWHLDVPDYDGYLACAYWLAAAGGGAFAANVLADRRRLALFAIGLCMAGGWVVSPAPFARTRHADSLARDLAEQVLREAPARAIVIAYADYFAGSLFYLQEAERQRSDVAVLAYGLSGSSWHWQHLQQLHPTLVPIDLRVRGDRNARVRAWLAANADRPVLVERESIARGLGLGVCARGLYFQTGAACERAEPPSALAQQLFRRELRRLDDGSPGALGAIAEVSQQLGGGYWRLGFAREAHDVLLAGVPESAWPLKLAAAEPLAHAGVWDAPEPRWQRGAALGDPARNLFLAGAIAAASGQPEAALEYLHAAARLGLPEAFRTLAHMPRPGASAPLNAP